MTKLSFAALLLASSSMLHAISLPPASEETAANYGRHIQRTMGLLASSTPDNRNAVKILFYGQSITGGKWHAFVERELSALYPNADLTVENRAIGGFSSSVLIRTLLDDLFASRPDLVVFHVYGDHRRYEEIIHIIRSRTSAEVLITTDHWGAGSLTDGEWKFDAWSRFFDRLLPLVAKKYDCELVDIRHPWKAYIIANKIVPADLLIDSVHLNDEGRKLMAAFVLRQMLPRPELLTETSSKLTTMLPVGSPECSWKGDTLEIEFTGTRVDAIRTHGGGPVCEIFIDGKRPSEIPNITRHNRCTSLAVPHEWPEICRIGFKKIPPPQIWTITLDTVNPETKSCTFHIEGSITGPDGTGSTDKHFTSNSEQVTLDPEDWNVTRKPEAFDKGIYKPGMKIRWESVTLSPDYYIPSSLLECDRVVTTILVDGLPNTHHTLRIVSGGIVPPITHLRIHTPPLADAPFQDMGVSPSKEDEATQEKRNQPTPIK